MDDLTKCYNKFKKDCHATQTSVLGARQYKTALLKTIKHILKITVPQIVNEKDFEVSDGLSKSDLESKLTKAIFLYSSFEKKVRGFVSFG